jgi:hypothetical protein
MSNISLVQTMIGSFSAKCLAVVEAICPRTPCTRISKTNTEIEILDRSTSTTERRE